MGFLSIIGTALTGGGFGLIGALFSKGMGIWEQIEKRKTQKMDYDHELNLLDKQQAGAAAESEHALAAIDLKSSGEMKLASYEHASTIGSSYAWVNAILSLVRPILTIWLVALTWYIYGTAEAAFKAEVIGSVLFMTSGAIGWWFGDRSMNKTRK
jgi:hypothetical protein